MTSWVLPDLAKPQHGHPAAVLGDLQVVVQPS